MRRKIVFFLLSLAAVISCSTAHKPATLQVTGYRIEKKLPADTSVLTFLQPYRKNMEQTMDKVIGFSNENLQARQPESGLGNFMADCMKVMAEKKFGIKVDAGFMNYGGMRSYIPKGNITVGKIFELMPFDNLLVLQEIDGSVLQQFLDKTAADGGWPVSSGLTMQIKNKKAVNVKVGGMPLNPNASYVIANSDYVANGGSDCDMLRKIRKQDKGYLMRDALIEFVGLFTQAGKPLNYTTEKRVYAAD